MLLRLGLDLPQQNGTETTWLRFVTTFWLYLVFFNILLILLIPDSITEMFLLCASKSLAQRYVTLCLQLNLLS